MANTDHRSRMAALKILSKLLTQQGSLASLLPSMTQELSAQQSAFTQALCYGACRWYPQLSLAIGYLLSKPLKPKDYDIQAILLLGIYQLRFMRTADHAAINESVNLAKHCKKLWAKKLINGVLRNFQRDSDTLMARAQAENPTAHPQWLAQAIERNWPQHAENILLANNQHAPFTIRVNQHRITRDAYSKTLLGAGFDSRGSVFSDSGLYLPEAVSVSELPGFTQGQVSVQDEAAQLAAGLMQLEPGIRVLDACCAPGGKTCHMLEKQQDLSVLALDRDERRLTKVRENAQRLDLNMDIVCGDATDPKQWWDGQGFDRILLDAPCSATGIVRRQPDIKLLRQPQHITALSQLQYQMLVALWPLLKEGGILLYATCSILPEENTQIVERFLAEQKNAKESIIEADWGIPQTCGRQLFPQQHGHDGFYYASLVKT